MPDLATALRRIHGHSGTLLDGATSMLRELVADACEALAAAEGSILVPVEGTNELRFFISLNPVLENEGVSVPIDGSISGYVFTTRQAMAKIKPESAGVAKVDEVARSQTTFLLAVPIVDDDRVYGVATFVNRTGEKEGTPFSLDDLRSAQRFGEIYATAMKLHRQIEFCTSSARIEVASHAREFEVAGVPEPAPEELAALRYRLPALLAEKAVDLPERERELLFRIGELIGEYAGTDGERVAYDL
ncbi:MAG: GAF domain-containing protein [Verrucomicrobiae bacterium]|nr:GAF domain-containing protein [Verrucomicrobiae bacterium]